MDRRPIEQDNRAAFVAEFKMWVGPKEVEEAILQLDSYLTWRDCKTALLFFVRRKDFFKTLESAKEALEAFSNMSTVKELDKNECDCIFFKIKYRSTNKYASYVVQFV